MWPILLLAKILQNPVIWSMQQLISQFLIAVHNLKCISLLSHPVLHPVIQWLLVVSMNMSFPFQFAVRAMVKSSLQGVCEHVDI